MFLDEPTTGLDPESRARVWSEVARLNRELGITIFLTTQYLEEADALAHRVGIISNGKLVAEGPPDHLKRSIGADLVVARVSGHDPAVLDRLKELEGVQMVSRVDDALLIAASDGPASVLPVASLLFASELQVESLTLRSPTPYAVALKTGSPAAVNASFVTFFPAFFLSDAIMPKQALTGWFAAIATYNPVTYVINALRALIVTGWDARVLLEGLAALTGIGLVSMSAALLALRGRIAQQS